MPFNAFGMFSIRALSAASRLRNPSAMFFKVLILVHDKIQMLEKNDPVTASGRNPFPSSFPYGVTCLRVVNDAADRFQLPLFSLFGKGHHRFPMPEEFIRPVGYRRHQQRFAAHGFKHPLQRRAGIFGENINGAGTQKVMIRCAVESSRQEKTPVQMLRQGMERLLPLPPDRLVFKCERRQTMRAAFEQVKHDPHQLLLRMS